MTTKKVTGLRTGAPAKISPFQVPHQKTVKKHSEGTNHLRTNVTKMMKKK